MANTQSSKGNPASKRMSNPNNKAKRARNKAKNEHLRAKNEHPKQLKDKLQKDQQTINKTFGRRHGHKVSEHDARLAHAIFGVELRPSLIKS